MRLVEAFDAYALDSRPNATQLEYLKDINTVKIRLIRAGGQCLAEGTLVATPNGPVAIQDLKEGDTVYNKNAKPIKVLATHNNGPKEVVELMHRGQVFVEATDEHVFLTKNSSWKWNKPAEERKVKDFGRDTTIVRNYVRSELGTVSEPLAYTLGALLGDGCSMQKYFIYISGQDEQIVQKCASQLGCGYKKNGGNNYTWKLETREVNGLYDRWCRMNYAHEKTVDIDVVKSWDRATLLQFLAGLVDTDGSVYVDSWNAVCMQIGMQALPVIEAVQYAFLALWQIPLTIHVDKRDKYVNGPVYYVKVANNAYSLPALRELDQYLVVPRKKWQPEYETFTHSTTNDRALGVKLGKRRVANTYDITVSSDDNLYMLANGLVTHNSGKSSTIAREYAWILTDTHPYWTRPESWGSEPYLMLIAGQDRRMMEMELWGKKLKPFLDAIDGEGVWREVRSGNALQYVENRKKGYKIVFLSHSDSSESNRKHMQGYVAHFVWMDELSNNLSIIEELQRRVQAKDGWFSLSFTPKGKAESIRNWADNIKEPYGKVYRMGMLDNPIYAARMDELKARLEHMPEGMRNTVLYGDWEVGDSTVYQFDWSMVEAPENYNKSWRHVEANDPAMAGKSGFLLFAEDPTSGVWYAVREEYIEGHYSPDNLVNYVKQITAPYNIVRRVADGHEAWYLGMASKMGLTYQVPYKKNERKDELIKGLQHALTNGRMKIAPWCRSFIAELQSAQWAEGEGKARIVNRKNLHLQDAAQYFVDCAPRPESPVDERPWWQVLREGNAARKKREKLRVTNKGRFLLTKNGSRRL
jgi:hypothetical protein